MTVLPYRSAEPRLRLVPRAPRPRRLSVHINALDGHSPYGRSRPFRIRDQDLPELIAAAEKLEVRR